MKEYEMAKDTAQYRSVRHKKTNVAPLLHGGVIYDFILQFDSHYIRQYAFMHAFSPVCSNSSHCLHFNF